MAAPKGNQFWKARTKHGRDKLFSSPEILWEACCEYFEWVENHPLKAAELVKYQGRARLRRVPRMRAMTIGGLCVFLGIHRGTWNEWRKVDDYSEVVTRVEEIIYDQKLTGAAADLLNANIIARELGLKDAQSVEHATKEGSVMVVPGIVSVDDWNKAAQDQQRQLKDDVRT